MCVQGLSLALFNPLSLFTPLPLPAVLPVPLTEWPNRFIAEFRTLTLELFAPARQSGREPGSPTTKFDGELWTGYFYKSITKFVNWRFARSEAIIYLDRMLRNRVRGDF